MERDWFEFIETTGFSKKLDQIAGPETLRAIQSDLIEDPERWPVIRGTNGARKGRAADPGRHSKGGMMKKRTQGKRSRKRHMDDTSLGQLQDSSNEARQHGRS